MLAFMVLAVVVSDPNGYWDVHCSRHCASLYTQTASLRHCGRAALGGGRYGCDPQHDPRNLRRIAGLAIEVCRQ
jgi:hypothetical protein